jgi:hypothetical protein
LRRAVAERHRFGHPEVDDLGHAIERHQDVLRRDVAMDEAHQLTLAVR